MVAQREDVARQGPHLAAHVVRERHGARLLSEDEQSAEAHEAFARFRDRVAALADAPEHAPKIALRRAATSAASRGEYVGRDAIEVRADALHHIRDAIDDRLEKPREQE